MSSWNYLGHSIGPPGCGKTYYARGAVARHLNEGGWAFVHDVNGEFRKLLPSYPTANAWREAMRAAVRERREMPRGAAIAGEVEDLLALVVELGERHNSVGAVRMRILLVLDEGVLVVTSGASWIGQLDAVAIARRRHLGLGIEVLAQDVQFHRRWYQVATDLRVWRMGNPRGLERLEGAYGIPPGSLVEQVPHLPEHRFLHVVNGKGFV